MWSDRVEPGRVDQVPLVLSLLPASLNLLCTWPRRNTTAAITARAMRATRRMYSTMLAPRSSLENLAWSHVFRTKRFMSCSLVGWLQRPAAFPIAGHIGAAASKLDRTLCARGLRLRGGVGCV